MAHGLDWSPAAVEDIDAIAASVAGDQPSRAESFVLNVASAAESIAERPEGGRVVAEFGRDDIRERFVYNYRVCYLVEAERVVILAVLHGPAMPRGLFQPPVGAKAQPPAPAGPPPKRPPRRRSA
ncbi:MAG: type II toxin-antitoxin system RelE/ParE family toxin [Nevskia sp.]|nr:type II toxin-antitoxin system RelE/ParE family toxin [Nevskia sp.]